MLFVSRFAFQLTLSAMKDANPQMMATRVMIKRPASRTIQRVTLQRTTCSIDGTRAKDSSMIIPLMYVGYKCLLA